MRWGLPMGVASRDLDYGEAAAVRFGLVPGAEDASAVCAHAASDGDHDGKVRTSFSFAIHISSFQVLCTLSS